MPFLYPIRKQLIEQYKKTKTLPGLFLLTLLGYSLFLSSIALQAGKSDTIDRTQAVWWHIIHKKETLAGIAQYYQIPVGHIKQKNSLTQNTLDTIPYLKIPIKLYQKNNLQKINKPFLLYKIQTKDQLHTVADTYCSSIEELKRINRLSKNQLQQGEYMLIPNNLGTPFSSKTNLSGFASIRFFAGSDWDGSTNVNYAISGRLLVKNTLIRLPFRMQTNFNIALGYRHDIGKHFLKNIDRIELQPQFYYYLTDRLVPFLLFNFRNQLSKSYFFNFNDDRLLIAAPFAPAYSHVAIGLGFRGDIFNIHLGLIELKATHVWNQALYEERTSAFGVKAGERNRIEKGSSLRADVFYYQDQKWSIQSNLWVFVNRKAMDVEFRVDCSYNLSKYFKLSLLFDLIQDKDVAENIQFSNEIALGFTFNK